MIPLRLSPDFGIFYSSCLPNGGADMGGLNVGEVGPLSGSLRELMEVEDLARSWVWRELLRERDSETGNEEEEKLHSFTVQIDI